MYRKFIKPIADFVLAFLFLLILSPLFLLIWVLLFYSTKGIPIFCQRRPGYQGKIFTIRKFRTMTNERDHEGHLLPDADRVTAAGKWIRKTSLDELPQLINVLQGEMSFIGPRPLLPEYLPLYNDFQRQRHNVKPGITGWAQINGRNAISWDKKFEYDIFYVQNCSFVLDVKILVKTLQKVLVRADITTQGMATTERFKGNESQ